jgi:hypothetical protein
MIYKVTLFDDWGKHLATEPLEAEDHSKAQSAAALILGICKDVAYSYEVRLNGAVVACGQRRRGLFDLSPLSGSRHANIIDVVERLQDGFTAVALSRRLRKTTARLRRCGTAQLYAPPVSRSPG